LNAFQRLACQRAEKIAGALRASVAPPEPWRVSVWNEGLTRSGAIASGGVPVHEDVTSAVAMAEELRQYAPTYVGDKQKSPLILAYATHLRPSEGGHRDDDCKAITGIILDCDKGGDPSKIRQRLQEAGIAYTYSYKPATGKFHIIVQIKSLTVPPGDRRTYANFHQSQFLHAIKAFSDLGDVEFDPAMAPILIHIDFPACRKLPADSMPVVEGHAGGPVDIEKFCGALGWIAPLPSKPYEPRVTDASDVKTLSVDDLRKFLLGKAHVLSFRGYTQKSLKHGDRLRVALAGEKAPCAPGEPRNQVWYREIVGTAGVAVSNKFPNVETDVLAALLAEIFTPALKRQHEQDLARGERLSPADVDALDDMFTRSIGDIRARRAKVSGE
jgi:hypothetical protein